MHNRTAIILLVCLVQDRAKELVANALSNNQDSTDKLIHKFGHEVFIASPLHRTGLDGTTLGKPGHLAFTPSASSRCTRPKLFSGGSIPFQSRGCNEKLQVFQGAGIHKRESLLSRRDASLATILAGLVVMDAQMKPAFAAVPKKTFVNAGYTDGPEGLKYRDLVIGDGTVAFTGAECTVNYVINLPAPPRSQVDKDEGFGFTLGSGEKIRAFQGWDLGVLGSGIIPPMRVGGTRQVLIPPQRAYGTMGVPCPTASSKPPASTLKGCPGGYIVPPDSTLELTIKLKSITTDENSVVAEASMPRSVTAVRIVVKSR